MHRVVHLWVHIQMQCQTLTTCCCIFKQVLTCFPKCACVTLLILCALIQVRVAVLAESCIQLQLTLKAYVLSKDHLTSLEQWQPAQHTVTEGVAGGEVQQTISCTEPGFGNGEGSAELMGGTSDFVFSGVRQYP